MQGVILLNYYLGVAFQIAAFKKIFDAFTKVHRIWLKWNKRLYLFFIVSAKATEKKMFYYGKIENLILKLKSLRNSAIFL